MNVLSFFRKPNAAQAQQTNSKPMCVAEPGAITFPRGGWAPAGYDLDGSYIVLSRKTGQLTTLRAQDLEEKKLLLKLGPAIAEIYRTVNPETLAPTFDPKEL